MGVKRLVSATAAALAMALAASLGAQDAPPGVLVAGGALRGAGADGIDTFKGIPYAAPPVGPLRWRAPQPPALWTGQRGAAAFRADCLHDSDPGDAAPSAALLSEDCLYLNVWRPAAPGTWPVLVWIHGGGYMQGGSSPALYDGGALAREGLVVVSLNYRLGRLGFFSHPALLRAADGETGNFAFMNQIAALRWVQDNIAAFGGDPARVTIMGESAGGDAVAHLMTSPRATGLFGRAVMLSGGGRGPILGGLPLDAGPGTRSALSVGRAFAEAQGIMGDGLEALAALRALPAAPIIRGVNVPGLFANKRLPETYAMGPILDGRIVTGTPGQVLRAGGAHVPLLIGTTGADISLATSPDADPFAVFGPDRARARAAYAAESVPSAIGADFTMQEPARFAVREVARAGLPAWLYRFDYVAVSERANTPGAPHASELAYLFGTLPIRYPGAVAPQDQAASTLFRQAVARFARTGDPNGPGLPAWPRHDPAHEGIMLFGREGGARFGPDPWRGRLDAVERAQPIL